MSGSSRTNDVPWQLQVFAVSVRKKEKWRWAKPQIESLLEASEKKCLDVGAGVGTLSILMERLGGTWDFTETDRAAAAATREVVHGIVYEIDIFDPKLQAMSYDLITVFDVIEHVPDPQKFMDRLKEILAPGGMLILTTPADDGGYYFWRRLAESWFGIDKAAHGHVVEGFAQQQLETFAARAGLTVSRLDPFSFAFTEMVELAYNGAYIMKNRTKQRSSPGYNLALSPASATDVLAHSWQMRVLRAVYPLLRGISLLDHALPMKRGYEWGLVAHKPISAGTTETAPH